MGVARIVRGQVLALKEREFIEAARAVGATRRYIVRRHLLPNSIGPIMVALSFAVVGAITAESTLAFLVMVRKLVTEQLHWGSWSVPPRVLCKLDIGG